jgi:glycosyltransferase involved in cell wall biosynthesis
MRVCAISFKECWRDTDGRWWSSGGFPLQMRAIGSLFDEMTLIITERQPMAGGIPLPEQAYVVPLPPPRGQDALRKLSVLFMLPRYLPILLRHVRRADVVHVPLPGDIPFLGMVVAFALSKRLIARYGGSWFPTNQTTLMNRVTREVMRHFAGGRNVMLATGEYPDPPAPNIQWVFVSAISRAELSSITPNLQRGLSSPPRLVYVGRLSPEKGVHNLIQAIADLRQASVQPLPRVLLIGDGLQRNALERMVEDLDLTSHCIFTGQLERQRLLDQMVQADLCVQPSLTEGFSKAWLEALMCGLPVLTTDVGSARSIVGQDGERGWVVPPDDVPALVNALQHILTASLDWPGLRQRCRDYVEGRTLEDWAELIGRICADQWGWRFEGGKLYP